MTGPQPGNGHYDPSDDDELDDDAPLDAAEEVAAATEALAGVDETLDERVESVVEELDGVERVRDGESVTYLVGGRPFAVLMQDVLEVALDPAVAKAALRTANTLASTRGAGLDRVHAGGHRPLRTGPRRGLAAVRARARRRAVSVGVRSPRTRAPRTRPRRRTRNDPGR